MGTFQREWCTLCRGHPPCQTQGGGKDGAQHRSQREAVASSGSGFAGVLGEESPGVKGLRSWRDRGQTWRAAPTFRNERYRGRDAAVEEGVRAFLWLLMVVQYGSKLMAIITWEEPKEARKRILAAHSPHSWGRSWDWVRLCGAKAGQLIWRRLLPPQCLSEESMG